MQMGKARTDLTAMTDLTTIQMVRARSELETIRMGRERSDVENLQKDRSQTDYLADEQIQAGGQRFLSIQSLYNLQ